MSLGIERAHYIALNVEAPEEAASFAVDKLGFSLAHSDGDTYYLKAHGGDPYSLVYRGRQNDSDPDIGHISYLVADADALAFASERLNEKGVAVEHIAQSPLWQHDPALRFSTPGGHRIELTTGVHMDAPMAAVTPLPPGAPAPLCLDHAVTRNIDPDAEHAFAVDVMGLRESARILAPDGNAVMAFVRAKDLFHCYASARAGRNGLHHFQVTLKNPESLYAAHAQMAADGVEILWGPLRHGPGHNVAFYIRDGAGFFVEYSTEEEIILDDDAYVPRQWSVLDQKSMDEWGSQPPEIFFAD